MDRVEGFVWLLTPRSCCLPVAWGWIEIEMGALALVRLTEQRMGCRSRCIDHDDRTAAAAVVVGSEGTLGMDRSVAFD